MITMAQDFVTGLDLRDKEHRQHARVVARSKVVILLPNRKIIHMSMLDISVGGFSALHDTINLPPDIKVQVAFKLPHYAHIEDREIHAICRVVYNSFLAAHQRFRIGFEFRRFKDPKMQEIVSEYVDHCSTVIQPTPRLFY